MKIHDVDHYHLPVTSFSSEDETYIKIGNIWYWSIGESLEIIHEVYALEQALKEHYENRTKNNN